MSSLRDFSEQRIDFYQHLVPNSTKIERKYFYANITFLTPHPAGRESVESKKEIAKYICF
jgi:hypothetical protein